jgi:hypothetical protein
MALLRGERPESTARLVDGALTVVQLLRGLLPASPDPEAPDTASPPQSSSPQQPASPGPAPSQDAGSPGHPDGAGLVRIDIR